MSKQPEMMDDSQLDGVTGGTQSFQVGDVVRDKDGAYEGIVEDIIPILKWIKVKITWHSKDSTKVGTIIKCTMFDLRPVE